MNRSLTILACLLVCSAAGCGNRPDAPHSSTTEKPSSVEQKDPNRPLTDSEIASLQEALGPDAAKTAKNLSDAYLLIDKRLQDIEKAAQDESFGLRPKPRPQDDKYRLTLLTLKLKLEGHPAPDVALAGLRLRVNAEESRVQAHRARPLSEKERNSLNSIFTSLDMGNLLVSQQATVGEALNNISTALLKLDPDGKSGEKLSGSQKDLQAKLLFFVRELSIK